MRLKCILALVFFPVLLFSQSANFELKLTIKGLNKEHEILLDAETKDSGVLKSIRVIKIDSQTFLASGRVNYPTAFRIQVKKRRVSRPFYLYKGYCEILTSFDSLYTNHKVKNSPVNDEFLYEYLPSFVLFRKKEDDWYKMRNELNEKADSLVDDSLKKKLVSSENDLQIERDSLFYKYVKKHPDSYLSLWKLSDFLTFFGYKNIYKSSYLLLNKKIQTSFDGKEIKNRFRMMAVVSVGQRFPGALLKDTSERTIDLVSLFKSKYILIDFWYSNCYPCLSGFEIFKQKLSHIDNSSLEIITISTDPLEKKSKLIDVINKQGLLWNNLWDIGGLFTKSLNISSFPTNFLLSSEGKILKRDVSAEEILEILKE